MAFFTDLNVNKDDIKSHPEVVNYFKVLTICEKRYQKVIRETQEMLANLRDRARYMNIKFKRIYDIVKIAKSLSADDVYKIVCKSVINNDPYIKHKNFVYECINTIHKTWEMRKAVKEQNRIEKHDAGKLLKEHGLKITIVAYAYNQYKAQLKLLKDLEMKSDDVSKLNQYSFLNSFINAYTKVGIDNYWNSKPQPSIKINEEKYNVDVPSLNALAETMKQKDKQLQKEKEESMKLDAMLYDTFISNKEFMKLVDKYQSM